MTSSVPAKHPKPPPVPTQEILAKVFHWVNILSLLVMLTSGLQIFDTPTAKASGILGSLKRLAHDRIAPTTVEVISPQA